jgi:hypothetical protein
MSLMPTVLQDAIVRVGDKFEKNHEQRYSQYGALKAFVDDTPMTLMPSTIENAKKSSRHAVKIPVINRQTAANVDVDSCTPPSRDITTAFQSVSFANYGFSVEVLPEAHLDNYVSVAESMQTQLMAGWKNIYERLDTASLAFLEANKNALTGLTSNHFTVASGALSYDYTKVDSLYGKVNGAMSLLDLSSGGLYKEVANTEALTSNLLRQTLGLNNQQNFAGLNGGLQGSSNFQTYTSNRLTTGLNKEVRYIFPEGSFAMLNWLDPKARGGWRISESEYWTTIKDPLFGQDFLVHYFKRCKDASATYSWLNATVSEAWVIVGAFGMTTPYTSVAGDRPNVKFTLA